MGRLGIVALALALWPVAASAQEKWMCVNEASNNNSTEYTISGDRLCQQGLAGEDCFHVTRNDKDKLVTFHRGIVIPALRYGMSLAYITIDKRTGEMVLLIDGVDRKQIEQALPYQEDPPRVSFFHCRQSLPPGVLSPTPQAQVRPEGEP